MKLVEKIIEIFKEGYICDSCSGRMISELLSGLTNEQRGKVIRQFAAFLIDSGEKIDVDLSNFYGIKFRNVKIKSKKPKKCKICKNFFHDEIDKLAKELTKKLKKLDFGTFLIGSKPKDEMLQAEEKLWNVSGIEFVEPIKSEINRELGKKIEKLTGKKFSLENPDVTTIVNLNTGRIRIEVRSLYILGRYQKLVRGIPQTKWICWKCKGRGCKYCNYKGKLYSTSVQEIIEKPFLKASKSSKGSFHGAGREDIDARCLDYRPFVIEIKKPIKRKIDLKAIEKEINKSKKVKVKNLRFTTKDTITKIKFAKIDKTYLAMIKFENPIDKTKLKLLSQLTKEPILQKTPLRVVHRRTDKFRRRSVKRLTFKIINKKTLQLKITAESGLYIKELITGDEGRTKPSVSEILENKAKIIHLDVIKIHSKNL